MPIIQVRPSNPTGSQCDPHRAKATKDKATIFTFRFYESGWDWDGQSPVTVTGGGSEFPAPSFVHPKGNHNDVVLFDCNTDNTQYKYIVKVVNTTTGAKKKIDPFIQNQ